MSKILETLNTSHNTWHNVLLYQSAQEARNAGMELMYDDKEGSVYGSSIDGGYNWALIGFVPHTKELYERYDQMAKDPMAEERTYTQASTNKIYGVDVTVLGGEMSVEEQQGYIQRAKKLYPGRIIKGMEISIVDEHTADIEYHYDTEPFQRIRRITGYLNDQNRFNNAKQAEVRDRVKHEVSQQSFEDVYVDHPEMDMEA